VARRLCTLLVGVVLTAPAVVVATGGSAAAGPVDAVSQAPSKVPSLLRQQADKIAKTVKAGRMAAQTADQLEANVLSVDTSGDIGVQVHGTGPATKQQADQLKALGATVKTSSADFAGVPGADLPNAGLISAMVPFDKLDAVAALPWVATLRPSLRPAVDVGAITTEGNVLHKADQAQKQGFTGRGVKVGAISGDVDHLAESVARGELPAGIEVLRQADYDDDEGTAMMEIVHDMAPSATFAYASTRDTNAEYFEAFHVLAAAGVDMITEDIALDDEPVFQQGQGATIAERLARKGIWVSSSAGNLGGRHGPRMPAKGTGRTPDDATGSFTDCPTAPRNTVNLRGTDNTQNLNLLPGAAILPTLQWSEPRAIFPTEGQGGFTDLNLYLMDAAGTTCLAVSNATQANGVGDTIEQFIYQNTTGAPQQVRLVVDVAGTSSARAIPTLDLKWRALTAGVQTIDPPERIGSMNPDANYTLFATSSAAANASVSVDPATVPLEAFSAAGPVTLFSTTRCPGGKAGPCKGIAGGPQISWPAPTWTASDGVSVSGVGPFGSGVCPATKQGDCRFFGTSAATPSAAGVAALTMEQFHNVLPPIALNFIMANRALPRDGVGWGHGVLSSVR
jgi:Subtilase family